LPSRPLPPPQEPSEHAPVEQVPVEQAGVPQVEQPPRVCCRKHPVLRTSKPANDPIHNQRFIAESFWASCIDINQVRMRGAWSMLFIGALANLVHTIHVTG
ncbi:MAG: hypothetical protein AAGJ83_00490, partial [Planctomycetota bacterium]